MARAAADAPLNFVDLGANVGMFSMRAIDLVRGSDTPERPVSVALVEGAPRNYEILSRRLAENDLAEPMVNAVNGLVGRREGSATIFQHKFHAINSVNNPVLKKVGSGVEVPFVDIEALTAHMPRIDLLKCDIEGSEEVFVTTYAGFFKRVQAAVFELHPTICDVPACRKVLAEAGLTEVTVLRLAGDQSVELFERP